MTKPINLLLAALLVTGCKSAPESALKTPPFSLPSGWMKVENAEQGITIGAPPGWGIGTADTGNVANLGELAGGNTQGLTSQIDKANDEQAKADVKALEPKGIYISCIDKQVSPVPGEQRTRFNVEKHPGTGNAQLDDAINKIDEDLTKADAPQMVDLPIGRVAKIHAHITTPDGGEVTRIYYGLVNRKDYYIVRFITEQNGYNLDKVATDVMQTLRIEK